MDSSLRAEATGTLPSTTALFLHWKAADQKKRGGGHRAEVGSSPEAYPGGHLQRLAGSERELAAGLCKPRTLLGLS